MSTLTLILLGIRLLIATFENAALVKDDAVVLHGIIHGLLSGQQPTPDQLTQLNTITGKLLAAELNAAIASGAMPKPPQEAK